MMELYELKTLAFLHSRFESRKLYSALASHLHGTTYVLVHAYATVTFDVVV